MKLTLVLTLGLAAAGCNPFGDKGPEVDPQVMPSGPAPPRTGGCDNENLEGTCLFDGIGALGGENASGPPGTTVYRINHQIQVKGEARTETVTSFFLRVPDESSEDLAAYYRERSPAPCKAYIVRPPCAPQATWVDLGFAPPPFAKEERF